MIFVNIAIWVVLLVFFIIIEMESAQLVSIWFAFGSLIAMILAAFSIGVPYQMLAFAIASLISILVIKTICPALGLFQMKSSDDPLAAEPDLVGKEGIALTEASGMVNGEMKIDGVTWIIFTRPEERVLPGQVIIVDAVQGNRLLVRARAN